MQAPAADECQVERVKRDKGNSLFSYLKKTLLLSCNTLAMATATAPISVFINTNSKHRTGTMRRGCFLLVSFVCLILTSDAEHTSERGWVSSEISLYLRCFCILVLITERLQRTGLVLFNKYQHVFIAEQFPFAEECQKLQASFAMDTFQLLPSKKYPCCPVISVENKGNSPSNSV